ncbi:MAG: hypothetical protein ACJ77K_18800 [Bacteroidia bacterium]
MKRRILPSITISTILSFYCNVLPGQTHNDLPFSKNEGTRVTFYYRDNNVVLHTGELTKSIPLPYRNIYSYSDPVLEKNKEKLYITASSRDVVNDCWNYFIFSINFNGNIEDTIYSAPKCIDIAHFSVSPDDSLILITEFNHFDWITCTGNGGKEGWVEKSFEHLILKISTGSVIQTISFSGFLFLDRLHGSMWSPDSKKVLISKRPLKNNCETYEKSTPEELYVYDLVSKQKQFISCCSNFSWSPEQQNIICYSKHSGTYLFNINTLEEDPVISLPDHSIKNVMWAPDGTTLLVQHFKILKREKIVTGDHAERDYYLLINTISKKKKTYRGYYDIQTWQ